MIKNTSGKKRQRTLLRIRTEGPDEETVRAYALKLPGARLVKVKRENRDAISEEGRNAIATSFVESYPEQEEEEEERKEAPSSQ